MKIMIDAGHGPNTEGKRTPDGMREFEFNAAVAVFLTEELEKLSGVSVFHVHSNMSDIPLKQRTDKANELRVDCYLSIHANAYGTSWNSAEGIETFVHSSKPHEAYQLANIIQASLIKTTGRKNRGVKTADFHVLRETKMTAILIECGFMTNKEEAALLRSMEYRKKCAVSIASSIKDYYKLKSKIQGSSKNVIYKVQTGAFSHYESAEKLANELRAKGFDTFITKVK
ncbi:N-acetylmuramoyl-L-alanine amidase [Bacillus sp. FJAT-49754]|nr:N-acetylmuramoyl-L-alanine amidase [Lederbergia citrea]